MYLRIREIFLNVKETEKNRYSNKRNICKYARKIFNNKEEQKKYPIYIFQIDIYTHMGKMVLLKYLKIWLDAYLKIILLDHQNNYVGRSSWSLECYNFLQRYLLRLSVPHNYFNTSILFSDLYLAKFLDTSAKSFFLCMIFICITYDDISA